MTIQPPMRDRYDAVTQGLHWLIAALVLAAYGLGLGREAVPKGEMRALVLSLHMTLGLAIVALMTVRIAWRLAAPDVAPVPMSPGMQRISRLAHAALYGLLLAVPLVGLAAAWLKGRSVGFAGWPVPNPLGVDVATAKMLEEAHEVLANGMMLLAGLHAGAAIVHHRLIKDDTLRRMLPRPG